MRRFIAMTLSFLCLASMPAHAFFFEAMCLAPDSKMKKCTLDFSKQNTLIVRYKEMQYQGLNAEIPGRSIVHLAVSEKSNFRKGATIGSVAAFGPIGALALLWKKKLDIFGIEYKAGKQTQSIMVGVKKKEGFQVANYLQGISGQKLGFGGGNAPANTPAR